MSDSDLSVSNKKKTMFYGGVLRMNWVVSQPEDRSWICHTVVQYSGREWMANLGWFWKKIEIMWRFSLGWVTSLRKYNTLPRIKYFESNWIELISITLKWCRLKTNIGADIKLQKKKRKFFTSKCIFLLYASSPQHLFDTFSY